MIEWRHRISRQGTAFVAGGTKGTSKKMNGGSGSTISRFIDAMRQILDIGVDQGQLAANPLIEAGVELLFANGAWLGEANVNAFYLVKRLHESGWNTKGSRLMRLWS
jgi:hypothetical protein